jgi:hypothetical protein
MALILRVAAKSHPIDSREYDLEKQIELILLADKLIGGQDGLFID